MSDRLQPIATLDANVLVAAPLSEHTPPGLIVSAWEAGRFVLVVSEHILDEVSRAHQKPWFQRRLSPAQMTRIQTLLRRRATIVPISVSVHGVATHRQDDLVLATAVSGGADYLVTGDEQFRTRVRSYQGVQLVTPAQFLAILDALP